MGSSESELATYPGLLIDWGGVLTTDVFASFGAFCDLEGLAPDQLIRVFREDAECRELILGLETGAVAQEQFEPRVASLLGVESSGLIDRLFAGSRPDEEMVEAVRSRRPHACSSTTWPSIWPRRRSSGWRPSIIAPPTRRSRSSRNYTACALDEPRRGRAERPLKCQRARALPRPGP